MMKSVLAIACSALLTCGLQAQISGSINRGAAKVTNSIEMGVNKLSVQYTALRFGAGEWQKIKDNEQMHERFNQMAEKRPVGTVETSVDLMAAGKRVAAGKYSMFFSVHPQAGWILNLKPESGDAVRWRMVLSDAPATAKCLKIGLEPSAKDGTCSLHIAFGDKHVNVPVTVAAAKK
ncbi:MAG: DUF2911 domain-containing protein [Planctomycetes bacterium]|nr:DUF2911 domain-containing protein [Planctomycetota bacterium]